MGKAVDTAIAEVIEDYIEKQRINNNRTASHTYKYGHGTIIEAARTFMEWADEAGYNFYRHDTLEPSVFALRIMSYVNGERVNSQSYEDARWIALQITLRSVHKDQPVITTYESEEPRTFDDLVALTRLLRDYADKAHREDDVELWSIIAEAEVKLLRLAFDRLEK